MVIAVKLKCKYDKGTVNWKMRKGHDQKRQTCPKGELSYCCFVVCFDELLWRGLWFNRSICIGLTNI